MRVEHSNIHERNTNYGKTGGRVEVDSNGDVRRKHKGGGYVYFVEGGGLVKIGVSVNPQKRIDSLRVGSPVPLSLLGYYPGGYVLEKDCSHFASLTVTATGSGLSPRTI